MKKVDKLLIVSLVLISCESTVFTKQKLKHVCAYSNESVANRRDGMVKHPKTRSLSHPGFPFDWPIDLCEFWISSLYGLRNNGSGKSMHYGVDMAAPKGTVVKAAADGIVQTVVKDHAGYGHMVEISHKNGKFVTRYGHLHRIHVKVGQKVKKGQKIGAVGATGHVRGQNPYHLHFEIFKDGVRLDPLKYLYSAEINYKNLKNKNILS